MNKKIEAIKEALVFIRENWIGRAAYWQGHPDELVGATLFGDVTERDIKNLIEAQNNGEEVPSPARCWARCRARKAVYETTFLPTTAASALRSCQGPMAPATSEHLQDRCCRALVQLAAAAAAKYPVHG